MGGGNRRHAVAVAVVSGIHQAADASVGESGLDARQIENNLAVHPEFDCSGIAAAWRDHDLEAHPLSDRNGPRGVIKPLAEFPGVRARASHVVGTPPEYRRGV